MAPIVLPLTDDKSPYKAMALDLIYLSFNYKSCGDNIDEEQGIHYNRRKEIAYM